MDMSSCRNVIRSAMFSVSNRAKLRSPPGRGGGMLERRRAGCERILAWLLVGCEVVVDVPLGAAVECARASG